MDGPLTVHADENWLEMKGTTYREERILWICCNCGAQIICLVLNGVKLEIPWYFFTPLSGHSSSFSRSALDIENRKLHLFGSLTAGSAAKSLLQVVYARQWVLFLLYYTQQCIFISKRLCGSCLLAADGRWREFHATSWRETFTWEYMKNRIYSIGLKAISLSNSSSPVQIQTLLFGMAERAISPR